MTIEHKNIPDSQLHEPKGVVSASPNMVLKCLTSGVSVFTFLGVNSLQGTQAGDGGIAGRNLQSDGFGGVRLTPALVYSQVGIVDNNNAFTLPTSSNANLETTSDYISLVGNGAPWSVIANNGHAVLDNKVTVNNPGLYRITISANIGEQSVVGTVGFKIKTGGTFLPRKTAVKMSASSQEDTITDVYLASLSAGTVVELMIASVLGGTIKIYNASMIVELVR